MPYFECGAIDHSATSPGAITGGLPPPVGCGAIKLSFFRDPQ
jgi:hypothetical protein